MNEAQKQCVDAAYEKLSEHFTGFVLVTMIESDDGHEKAHTTHYGGFYTALGLLADAKRCYEQRNFAGA